MALVVHNYSSIKPSQSGGAYEGGDRNQHRKSILTAARRLAIPRPSDGWRTVDLRDIERAQRTAGARPDEALDASDWVPDAAAFWWTREGGIQDDEYSAEAETGFVQDDSVCLDASSYSNNEYKDTSRSLSRSLASHVRGLEPSLPLKLASRSRATSRILSPRLSVEAQLSPFDGMDDPDTGFIEQDDEEDAADNASSFLSADLKEPRHSVVGSSPRGITMPHLKSPFTGPSLSILQRSNLIKGDELVEDSLILSSPLSLHSVSNRTGEMKEEQSGAIVAPIQPSPTFRPTPSVFHELDRDQQSTPLASHLCGSRDEHELSLETSDERPDSRSRFFPHSPTVESPSTSNSHIESPSMEEVSAVQETPSSVIQSPHSLSAEAGDEDELYVPSPGPRHSPCRSKTLSPLKPLSALPSAVRPMMKPKSPTDIESQEFSEILDADDFTMEVAASPGQQTRQNQQKEVREDGEYDGDPISEYVDHDPAPMAEDEDVQVVKPCPAGFTRAGDFFAEMGWNEPEQTEDTRPSIHRHIPEPHSFTPRLECEGRYLFTERQPAMSDEMASFFAEQDEYIAAFDDEYAEYIASLLAKQAKDENLSPRTTPPSIPSREVECRDWGFWESQRHLLAALDDPWRHGHLIIFIPIPQDAVPFTPLDDQGGVVDCNTNLLRVLWEQLLTMCESLGLKATVSTRHSAKAGRIPDDFPLDEEDKEEFIRNRKAFEAEEHLLNKDEGLSILVDSPLRFIVKEQILKMWREELDGNTRGRLKLKLLDLGSKVLQEDF